MRKLVIIFMLVGIANNGICNRLLLNILQVISQKYGLNL